MGRNDKDFADVTLACGDLKLHSGEKSNKCNQCDYASSFASDLRTHLKRHSGEKSNKCSQCDYASIYASTLRTHLKHTVEKSQTNASNATNHSIELNI